VVADILADPAARAVTFGLNSHLHTAYWSAVKTGTSEDMRDNWCVGFSGQFTVAVWVGNFEGDSMHEVSGVTGAAPIWHELMSALHPGPAPGEPDPPPGLSTLPTRFSPAVEPPRREWYLSGATMSTRESSALPGDALPGIESPADGLVVALDPDIPANHQRLLISVRGAHGDMRLRLNDRILEPATRQLWTPRPGSYHLTLENERGQAISAVHFTVRGAAASDAR
jgi:penicillin-binding protein 1C